MSMFSRVGRHRRGSEWYALATLAAAAALAACSSNNNSKQSSSAATQPATVGRPSSVQLTATPSRPALPGTATAQSQATASPTRAATTAAVGTAQPASAALQAQIVEPKQGNAPSEPMTWTYAPNPIKVPVGASVTWTNTGISTHTVTADDGKSFDSDAIQRGDTWTFTFQSAGTFTYRCTFHNWMKGSLVVGG